MYLHNMYSAYNILYWTLGTYHGLHIQGYSIYTSSQSNILFCDKNKNGSIKGPIIIKYTCVGILNLLAFVRVFLMIFVIYLHSAILFLMIKIQVICNNPYISTMVPTRKTRFLKQNTQCAA